MSSNQTTQLIVAFHVGQLRNVFELPPSIVIESLAVGAVLGKRELNGFIELNKKANCRQMLFSSTSIHPSLKKPKSYIALFSQARSMLSYAISSSVFGPLGSLAMMLTRSSKCSMDEQFLWVPMALRDSTSNAYTQRL